jgi:hypothetical protein
MLAGKTTVLERPFADLAIGSVVPSASGRDPTGGSDGEKQVSRGFGGALRGGRTARAMK